MISGILKKVIFFSSLFIYFHQPSKLAEASEYIKNVTNENILLTLSDSSKEKNTPKPDNILNNKVYVEFLNIKTDSLLASIAENKQELIIQSDKQSEINDVIYAEGNVSLSYKGKFLQADKLTYDKLNKQISAK